MMSFIFFYCNNQPRFCHHIFSHLLNLSRYANRRVTITDEGNNRDLLNFIRLRNALIPKGCNIYIIMLKTQTGNRLFCPTIWPRKLVLQLYIAYLHLHAIYPSCGLPIVKISIIIFISAFVQVRNKYLIIIHRLVRRHDFK